MHQTKRLLTPVSLRNWQCRRERCNLHQFSTDLPLRFQQEIFISSDAIFDSGLFCLAERNLLEQPQEMLLALQQ